MRDRYYISFNAGGAYSEFWPTNTPKIQYRKQSGEIFKRPFIDKFKIGRLKNATVFDLIAADFYDKTKFATDYWYKIEVLSVAKFYFIGPVTDGNIDDQNDVYEVTPKPKDIYRTILQEYEKKWQDRGGAGHQIFSVGNIFYRPKLNTNVFVNVDFTEFTDVAHTITYKNNTGGLKTANNQLIAATINTDKIIILIKNRNIATGADPHMQLVNSVFGSISNQISISANGKYTLTQLAGSLENVYVEFSQIDVAGSNGSLDYEIFYPTQVSSGALLEDLLLQVINGATYMNLGLTLDSTYLWNDLMPTGHLADTPTISAYMTTNPTYDYVRKNIQNWNCLWLARNDAFTTAQEDLLELSLKDIMDFIKIKLRAWWFIDTDGHFRIEHEYYFRDFSVQANITSATYSGDKPEVDSRLYRYEKGDVYSQLNYKEQNQSHEDWIPYPIEFSSTLTSNNKKDISLAYFGSDLEYLMDAPGDAASSGWILLRCIAMGANYLVDIDASTLTPTNFYMNARLGWAYLFANYWDWFAEAETGFVNNGAHTFTHVKEFLKQGHIKFRMTADLDWKKPFTLLNGKGWMEDSEYIPETGMYDINVGYNPYE